MAQTQLGFYVDMSRCIGCKTCSIACKDKNDLDVGVLYRRVIEVEGGGWTSRPAIAGGGAGGVAARAGGGTLGGLAAAAGGGTPGPAAVFVPDVFAYWISISCNHCDDPRCLPNCPTGAITKRAGDGIVTIDQETCIGCKYCTWSCPYGAPQYNARTGKAGKCDLCVDLLERGEEPICVTACPMRAIEVGPIEELRNRYAGGEALGTAGAREVEAGGVEAAGGARAAVTGASMALTGLPDPALTRPNALYKPHRDAVPGRRRI